MRFRTSLLAAAALMATAGAASADTWDNYLVANPIANNTNAVNGSFSDWLSGYTDFGTWHQWYDGNYDYPTYGNPKSPYSTSSRMAINTTTNRLIIGIQSNEPAASYELNGLFGGTSSIEGVRADHVGGPPGTGTQLHWEMPASPSVGSNIPLTIGGYEVLARPTVANPSGIIASAANVDGVSGAYSYDGSIFTIEVSIPIKFDWTQNATPANTYNLNDLAGLVGGSGGLNNLNVAYNVSLFNANFTTGDAQGGRFDGATQMYGNTHQPDYWYYRAVNSLGVGPNSTPTSYPYGGLTLVGTPLPEPASLGLLALGGLMTLRRRR